MRSLADASLPPSRTSTHGSGSMWIATPSSYRTCTDYSLPVSRRTAKDSVRHPHCPSDWGWRTDFLPLLVAEPELASNLASEQMDDDGRDLNRRARSGCRTYSLGG